MRHTQLEKPASTPAQSKDSGLDRAQRPPAPIGNRAFRSLLSSERGIEGAATPLVPRLATLVGNQAFASFLRADAVPPVVNGVLEGAGQPLDHETRIDLESRFGQDFGTVREHTDSEAAKSAEAIGARAYTVGHDIVFREGQYAPTTAKGRQTLAHELAHVVQQRRGGAVPEARSGATHEQDADQAAVAVVTGRPAVQVQAATAPGLAREADPETEAIEKALKEAGGPGRQVQPSPPGQPPNVGPQKALTPQELIDEHIFTPRVSEEVGDLQRRLADRERALAANPGDQALKKNVESLRVRVRALTVVDPAGTGADVPGHGNVNTRAAIQVVDGEGNMIALERGAWGPGRHAEVDALSKLDARLGGRKLPPGTRMDVAGNQVVCTDVCRPAVKNFAQKYGIRLEEVYTHVRTRPKMVGTGRASGKTTERTALRSGIPQAEVGSEPLFGKGPGTTGSAPKGGSAATEVHEGTAAAPLTKAVTKPSAAAKTAPAGKTAPAAEALPIPKAAPTPKVAPEPAPSGKEMGVEHPSSGPPKTAPPKAVKAPSTAPVTPTGPAPSEAPTHAIPHPPTAARPPVAKTTPAAPHLSEAVEAAPPPRTGPRAPAGEWDPAFAGHVAGEIISFIGMLYLQRKMDELNEQKRHAELEALQPEIGRRLAGLQDTAGKLQAAGKHAFVNVTLMEVYQSDDEGLTSFANLRLLDVKVSDQNIQESIHTQLRPHSVKEAILGFIQWSFGHAIYRTTYSWEVPPLEPRTH